MTDAPPPRPIRWLLALAGRLLPEEVRDEIVADLRAEHRAGLVRGDSAVRRAARLAWDLATTEYVALHRVARRARRRRAAAGRSTVEPSEWTPGPGGRMVGIGTWRVALRPAVRVLARRRGFTLLATGTIAVGVGSVAATVAVASSILLRPLPYRDADALVTLWYSDPQEGHERINASAPQYWRWRERVASFAGVEAYRGPGWTLVTDGPDPERVPSVRVTSGFFDLLGVRPLLGRSFVPGDAASGTGDRVILSHSLWDRLGRPEPADLVLSLDEAPATVVGIMAAGFTFLEPGVDVWRVEEPDRSETWDQWTMKVFARLAPGVHVRDAAHTVAEQHAALLAAQPGLDVPPAVVVRPLLDEIVGSARGGLLAAVGAVVLALLITVINVGGLFLARNVARRSELAMMSALGASRSAILGHIVAQSVALAGAGLALGVPFAIGLVGLAKARLPADFPRADAISFDGWALAAAVTAAAIVAIGAGLLSIPRGGPAGVRGHRVIGGESRALAGILIGQTAIAVVLLVAGGLLVRSFFGLTRVDPGIEPSGVVALDVRLPPSLADDDAAVRAFVAEVDHRVAALRGVTAVGQIQRLPFAGGNWSSYVLDPERARQPPYSESDVRVITPGYLEAIGLPLLRGRRLDERDAEDAPLAVMVNELLAEDLWPSADPLGRHLVVDMFDAYDAEVVGIVGPVRHHGLDAASQPELYVPYAQAPVAFSTLVVRGADAVDLVAGVRRAVHEVRPLATVSGATPLVDLVDGSIATERMHAYLFGALALLALTLAAVGIFGVASFTVAQQRLEMGIRAVLGATGARLRRAVLLRMGRLLAIGMALGFATSLLLLRGLSGLLVGLATTDPTTYAVVAGVLGAIGLVASLLPANRAARVDPIVAINAMES